MSNDLHGTQARGTERTAGGHTQRHGRPASWIFVGVVIAAFTAGGTAVIDHLWVLFWVCAGIVLLAVPVGKIIGIMNDTVMVDERADGTPPAADRGTVADPGVRVE